MAQIPKQKRFEDRKWLDHLRTRPCILTGLHPNESEAVDPMHIGTLGRGMKAHDYWALPVRHHLHQLGHNIGEISMLRHHAPDWLLREAFRCYAKHLYDRRSEWDDSV